MPDDWYMPVVVTGILVFILWGLALGIWYVRGWLQWRHMPYPMPGQPTQRFWTEEETAQFWRNEREAAQHLAAPVLFGAAYDADESAYSIHDEVDRIVAMLPEQGETH